ncbi:hypothetical protein FRC08_000525 [Ceratobasidium sp. 394]|nr:hypothetical protein FRC08_000525 [Ceratobasidium sp. 394]
MLEQHFPKLYAVVIGINKCKSPVHPNLEGCIHNAISVFNYLTETLQVPEEYIVCLFDEQATWKEILDVILNHLILNEKIQPLDPILVYFSG